MLRSLVGSEMCIRDRALSVAAIYIGNTLAAGEKNNEHSRVRMFVGPPGAVSYTHLTLPTIYSV